MTTVYLDHNASAPLLAAAREAMVEALALVGNPSSVHGAGRVLRARIDDARDKVAALAGAEPKQVVFTSSATEALTQAILGGARTFDVDRIVHLATDHAAVLKAAQATGLPVDSLEVDRDGVVSVPALQAVLDAAEASGETLLFTFAWVNNETGVIQPKARIEALIGPSRHILVIDAVQAFGKLGLEFSSCAADMVAVSAHKIGGPAGIGALLAKGHCDTVRLIPGGGQEQGRRGGTESAAMIVGFGAACGQFSESYAGAKVTMLTARLETELMRMAPELVVFGSGADRVGNCSNFAVPGLKNTTAMMSLDLKGIAISSGSACSSGKVGRSHVLAAMGVAPQLSECGLRISTGWSSNEDDIDAFLGAFATLLNTHRARNGAAA